MTATLHVLPIGDLVEHVSDDECCCGPKAKPIKDESGSMSWIMIHHSLDGREIIDLDRIP